ncbi:MAG: MlaD family protein [Flavisolibacter sp.]
MKLSNESKVGILAFVAILVLVIGFYFLKGKSLFSKTPVLFAVFKNIGSLEKSNAVKINGLPIGSVYNYIPGDKEVNNIVVEIHMSRDVAIPTNSQAFIDGSLVGASYINVGKGDATTYLKSGDTISTKLVAGLMGDLKSQLTPTITRVNQTLDSLKQTIGAMSGLFDPGTKNNIHDLIANLTLTSGHMQNMLNDQTGTLAKTLNNLNAITGNLAKNNDAINGTIKNIELTTSKLASANIEGTMSALQGTINELKATITGLNSKNGSLGLMMNDRQLYDHLNSVATRLNTTALSAEILLDDVRLHPKRYVNISVFGGKPKGAPLTSPAVKDSVPTTRK